MFCTSKIKSYLDNRIQCVLLHGSYPVEDPVKCGVPQGSILRPIRFSLCMNVLPLHVQTISVDCNVLADDTTLHTSGRDILQIKSSMQDISVRYPVSVTIIIQSSIRSRPNL